MKTLKWFKVGEPIPTHGVYIKSDMKIVGHREVRDGQFSKEIPVKEEQHLYEIPIRSHPQKGKKP